MGNTSRKQLSSSGFPNLVCRSRRSRTRTQIITLAVMGTPLFSCVLKFALGFFESIYHQVLSWNQYDVPLKQVQPLMSFVAFKIRHFYYGIRIGYFFVSMKYVIVVNLFNSQLHAGLFFHNWTIDCPLPILNLLLYAT